MLRNKSKISVLSIFLAVILCAMLTLCGCSGFFGARVDAEGTDPYQTPNIRGVWDANSINSKIQPYFNRVIEALKQANSNEANELVGKMRYSVETVDGQTVLCSWIEGTSGQRVPLPNIVLTSKDCEVADSIPECLSDYETLKYAMTVANYGVDIDLYSMDSTISFSQMADILISWYESKIGSTVDYSGVTASISEASSLKLLSLIPDYKYSDKLLTNRDATTTAFIDTLASLMSRLDFELYGVGSGNIKLMDFVRYAELYLGMYAPEGIDYSYPDSGDSADDISDNVKLSTDWAVRVSEINLYNSIDSVMAQSEEAVTRLSLADNMLRVLKAGYDTDVKSQSTLSDCSDESAEVMVQCGIMGSFPENSNLFSPDYKLRANELPSIVAAFTEYCFNSWNDEGSYHYYDNLTMNIVCTSFASLESFYINQNYYPPEEPAEHVNNGIDTDWFMVSSDSGEYSDKNVTVAASAMALHWTGHNEYSVESLRSTYISDTDSEWSYDFTVSVLAEYGENAKIYKDAAIETVLSELRSGNIIIAKYADGNSRSDNVGSMVIYGFHKSGNSVKLIVNDPNVKYSQSTYANGNIPGKAEEIEGELALWLINRAGGDYIVVYADGNSPTDISETDR